MHDTEAMTGGVAGFPLPAVSFTFTSSYTAAGGCAAGAAVANSGTEAGVTAKSADSASLGANDYAYRAVVAGNDNYLGDTSVCEPFTVNKRSEERRVGEEHGSHGDKTDRSVP